ncbi:hypothetical protein QBC36DRAFT_11460 [Triangularia setosa]|uniref:PWWP domain-containing protein n=1 Tax=Triangularia setosa TaxID=2587417 RepID=A0AAN7A7L3_9PEZI|nr:hypothetical protein QBC36DRAFT_11460 [Podospora setosa]
MSREGTPVAPTAEAAQPAVEKEDAPIAPAAESKDAVESAPAEEASDKPEEAPEKTPEQAEDKPDVDMTDVADVAEADAPSQPPADNYAEMPPKGKAAKRKSIGAAEGKGKKLNRKASKPRILHTGAQPGEYYFVKLKGHPQWPVIVCDEEMLPESLLKSRPVTAKRQDGTYRDDYADGAKKVADRTFPVMYLYTNEFGWVPNADLIDLDPEEVKNINTDKMRKDLQAAHKLAAENHPLQYYKDVLHQFQQELIEKEKAKAAKAATPKGKKKSAVVVDEDVDMDDDAENGTPPKEKKSKKRKADEPAETPQRTESVKKTKIKLTSNATSKTTNGATPSAKAKTDAKSTKAKSKKVKDGEDKKAEKEASEAPKEPELSPQEQRERKEREVLFLRHKLQKGLLTRDQEPKPDEMATMSEYITKLEGFPNLEVSIIRTTKINKVLKAILKLENIPKEKEFNFKSRSQVLLNKWNELLAVDGGATAPAPAAKAVNGTAPKEAKANGVKADEPAKAQMEDSKEEPKEEKKGESPAEEKPKEKSEEASEPSDKMDVDEAKAEAVEASA